MQICQVRLIAGVLRTVSLTEIGRCRRESIQIRGMANASPRTRLCVRHSGLRRFTRAPTLHVTSGGVAALMQGSLPPAFADARRQLAVGLTPVDRAQRRLLVVG